MGHQLKNSLLELVDLKHTTDGNKDKAGRIKTNTIGKISSHCSDNVKSIQLYNPQISSI